MATKKPNAKMFCIGMKLTLDIGLEISAESLSDAVTKAEAMKVHEMLDFHEQGWDHNDSSMAVTGVFTT